MEVAKLPFVERVTDDRAAIPLCRQGIELTRTAIGAITIGKFTRFDFPLNVWHERILIMAKDPFWSLP